MYYHILYGYYWFLFKSSPATPISNELLGRIQAMNDSTEDTLFEFPCEFPLKVMGRNIAEFEGIVIEIVNRHVANLGENALKKRDSGNGKFISITVTFEAQSKQQLDNLYRELHAHEHVLMLL